MCVYMCACTYVHMPCGPVCTVCAQADIEDVFPTHFPVYPESGSLADPGA